LKHAASLIQKGCKIGAIKAGASEAGSRAASSHTGALSSPDTAVEALFRKAGIVRCHGREELATVAAIFMHPQLKGNNLAIITHAGGPAVMLTDVLSNNGIEIPPIEGPESEELLQELHTGSSVANPIDFLATGTGEQLGKIIDYCSEKFNHIDGMAVIFGNPGLFPVHDVYDVLHKKMKKCKKPIYPILPSVINAKDEIKHFISHGRINFPEEVMFGQALGKIFNTRAPASGQRQLSDINAKLIRSIVDNTNNGYLHPDQIRELLDATGIKRAGEATVKSRKEAMAESERLGFPVVMKVIGPVHKSDVNGIALNVSDKETAAKEYDRMISIKDATGILIQPMLKGTEMFIGAKRENKFGHMVLCGIGGIFIEVLKDISYGLTPIDTDEAKQMIHNLKGYGMIQGTRGQEGVNEESFAEAIMRISALVEAAPEIAEMDINPLLGNKKDVTAVDTRIRIEKQ
ncbi:MAG: acetate--CoA ligase family protein, partial [Bacteroidota bacterium]